MASPAFDTWIASRSEQSPVGGDWQALSSWSSVVLISKVLVPPWAGPASASTTSITSGGTARRIRIGPAYPPISADVRPLISPPLGPPLPDRGLPRLVPGGRPPERARR